MANWFKLRLGQVIAFIVGLVLIDSIAMMYEPAPSKPKGRLAKFFYVSEVARVPIVIAIGAILTPLMVAHRIYDRRAEL